MLSETKVCPKHRALRTTAPHERRLYTVLLGLLCVVISGGHAVFTRGPREPDKQPCQDHSFLHINNNFDTIM